MKTNVKKAARHVLFSLPVARDLERLPLEAPVRGPRLLAGMKLFFAGAAVFPLAFVTLSAGFPVASAALAVVSAGTMLAGGLLVRGNIDHLPKEMERGKADPLGRDIRYICGRRCEGARHALDKLQDCRERIGILTAPYNKAADPEKIYKKIEAILEEGENALEDVRVTRFGRPATFSFF